MKHGSALALRAPSHARGGHRERQTRALKLVLGVGVWGLSLFARTPPLAGRHCISSRRGRLRASNRQAACQPVSRECTGEIRELPGESHGLSLSCRRNANSESWWGSGPRGRVKGSANTPIRYTGYGTSQRNLRSIKTHKHSPSDHLHRPPISGRRGRADDGGGLG